MEFRIEVADKVVRDALKDVQRQAPFAVSLAVNSVARDAQADVRKGYQERFQLRRPDFILKQGAHLTQGKKSDPTAILRVSERASFLVKFEDGTPKVPDGKAIAVPVDVRRSKSDIIPRSQRPPALYASKAAGAGRVFSKAGKLMQKVGRGAAARLRVLYIWKASVRTPALLRFKETVNEAVDRNWQKRALEAVDRALSTMR